MWEAVALLRETQLTVSNTQKTSWQPSWNKSLAVKMLDRRGSSKRRDRIVWRNSSGEYTQSARLEFMIKEGLPKYNLSATHIMQEMLTRTRRLCKTSGTRHSPSTEGEEDAKQENMIHKIRRMT